MPKKKSVPYIGTKLEFLAAGGANNLHKYINSRHKKLGPIFKECLGGKTDLVFLSDPELIRTLFMNLEGKYPIHILPEPWVLYEKVYGAQRGLFFMDGEEWLHNRRILNKFLLKESGDDWIGESIEKTVTDTMQSWKLNLENGGRFPNIDSELYRLSTNVIVNILLGTHGLEQSRHYNEMLSMLSDSVKKIFYTTTKLYSIPVKWCQKLNLKVWRDFKESVDLSLFLAKKITREMIVSKNESDGLIKRMTEEDMSPEIITRIVSDLIIAAGDTVGMIV
ncbi:unnamed protein product [Danaus chrysippus]|uniref:(African queen) hypothetical protein n=1 Tax=Danaus chrysippus TaxID=151541 RepID=A0A8J2QG21_9NEOP|nr:unnamed protein product [Danaus chrysippus]